MIRDAAPSDFPAIRQVIRHAFDRADEANLVEQLRADGDVLMEMVIADDIAVQAHILYSKLSIESPARKISAAALAPVSVLPAFQRRGFASLLITTCNARFRAQGLEAILVVGHADYYPRFGFSAKTAESLEAPVSGPSFMALELAPGVLAAGGRVRYAPAFGLNT